HSISCRASYCGIGTKAPLRTKKNDVNANRLTGRLSVRSAGALVAPVRVSTVLKEASVAICAFNSMRASAVFGAGPRDYVDRRRIAGHTVRRRPPERRRPAVPEAPQ